MCKEILGKKDNSNLFLKNKGVFTGFTEIKYIINVKNNYYMNISEKKSINCINSCFYKKKCF